MCQHSSTHSGESQECMCTCTHTHARTNTHHDLKRFRSSLGKTHSEDIHPQSPASTRKGRGWLGSPRENGLFATQVGQGVRKLRTKEELAEKRTHVIVFLSGQRWLQGPFWGPHRHLHLGDLGRDTGRKNLVTLSLSKGISPAHCLCLHLLYCHQGVCATYW